MLCNRQTSLVYLIVNEPITWKGDEGLTSHSAFQKFVNDFVGILSLVAHEESRQIFIQHLTRQVLQVQCLRKRNSECIAA